MATSEGERGPLGLIGLALSGGGFRAAAFHLGALKALHRLGLLDDVRYLSTASGGSLLAAAYVTSVVNGDDFDAFFAQTQRLLARNLVREALDHLHEDEGRPSLVKRAADVYATVLRRRRPDGTLEDLRLGALADDARVKARFSHVVINATHFSLGYGFRFTFPPRPRARFGNKCVKLEPPDAWRDVRLADAVAASACFPAGFEPLLFPTDFAWTGRAPEVTADVPESDAQERVVPLMDGGIYDNQATGSLLLIDEALERREARERGEAAEEGEAFASSELGLVLVSDTDQKQMPFYAPPVHHRGVGSLPVGAWLALSALVAALGAAGAALLDGWLRVAGAVGATLGALPVLAAVVLLGVARRALPFQWGGLAARVLGFPVNELKHFVAERLASVLALTTTVFMSRVRGLQYEVAREQLGARLLPVHVYDADTKASLGATPALRERAERARAVPTTLWMSEAQRDDVVATGYATTLAVLHGYLERWRTKPELRSDLPFPEALAREAAAAWREAQAT